MPVKRISIHALHEESDVAKVWLLCATIYISIHALHEESDNRHMARIHLTADFNPRSP